MRLPSARKWRRRMKNSDYRYHSPAESNTQEDEKNHTKQKLSILAIDW